MSPSVSDVTLGPGLSSALADHPLLAAAARVFIRKGYEASTVEDILQEASISRRTFYKSYRSKEDALVALHRAATDLMIFATEAQAAASGSPEEKWGRIIDVFIGSARTSSGLIAELQSIAQRRDSPLFKRRQETVGRMVELFRAHVTDELDPLTWVALLSALDGVVRGLAANDMLNDAVAGQVRTTMLRLFRGACPAKLENRADGPIDHAG